MIDYLMQFASEDAAKADPAVGKYWLEDGRWDDARCIVAPLIWRAADDAEITSYGPGDEVWTSPKHMPFDKNWYILIGLPEEDVELEDAPSCALAIVRETGDVLQSTFTALQLAALNITPLFSGSSYGQGKPVGVK